jgi:hypothetical protein
MSENTENGQPVEKFAKPELPPGFHSTMVRTNAQNDKRDTTGRAPVDQRPPAQPIARQPGMTVDANFAQEAPYRVTPSLNPASITGLTVDSVPVYNERTSMYLDPVARLFENCTTYLDGIFRARVEARNNPAWTPAQALLQISKTATVAQERMTKGIDSVTKTLETQAAQFEEILNQPIVEDAKADRQVSSDICQHFRNDVKNMHERQKLLNEAQKNGDMVTLAAVLSRPAFLSGFDRTIHEGNRRRFKESIRPLEAEKLRAINTVRKVLGERAWLVVTQTELAMGAAFEKVNRIKNANDAATQALILGDWK